MKTIPFLFTLSLILLAMTTHAQNAEQALTYKIYRADGNSFHVASVLVQGEKDAVLIDAQFTLSDAHRVVADIFESKKNLTAIYVSHGDPDYYFGLNVLKNAFPHATIYATEHTIKHIKKTYQQKLDYWGPILGSNGTTNIVLPQVLKGNTIELEGNTLEIKGLDSPSPERTYVWIPSIKTIVGGVNVYDNLHLWIADAGTKEEREAWLDILKGMEKLDPEVVIPAHALNDDNIAGKETIAYSRSYLKAYEKEAKKAEGSAQLIAAMEKLYPNAQLAVALQIGAKVAKGEMTW